VNRKGKMMTHFSNSRKAIERAEKIAARLELQRVDRENERKQVAQFQAAVTEAKSWKKPASLKPTPVPPKRTRVRRYEFTDTQLEIAFRSLNAGGSV
jgi:hypothetical protein